MTDYTDLQGQEFLLSPELHGVVDFRVLILHLLTEALLQGQQSHLISHIIFLFILWFCTAGCQF